MAMAMRLAAQRGLSRRLFSSFPFTVPNTPAASTAEPPPEPSTNLFVSGLSKRTTSEGLRKEFEKFGQVVHAQVVTDRVNGYSKGFGFVRYATLEEAAAGKEGMDAKYLDGWVIFTDYARPRTPQQPRNNPGGPPSSRY